VFCLFVQCFDIETKNKLISMGLILIKTEKNNEQYVFTFSNNKAITNFDNMKVCFTKKMIF